MLSAADSTTHESVLWTYDPVGGTFTELPGSPVNPDHITAFPVLAFNTEAVFSADAAGGRHLYTWDGTAFTDLTPTGNPDSPTDEVVYHNSLYFIAVNGTAQLYYYNGGGAPIGATTAPGDISKLSVADDTLYFQGDHDGDNSTPDVLLSLDDSTGTVSPVLFAGSQLAGGTQVVSLGAVDYVSSNTIAGLSVYRFAGAGAPLETVGGITQGDTGAAVGLGGILYLPVRVFPVTLYAIDGISAAQVAGSPADADRLQVLNGTLFFRGTDDLAAADRLWELVPAADPGAPALAATGVDGTAAAFAAGAALVAVFTGLALLGAGIVRNRRLATR
jgi:hypothetical protein